MKIVKKVEFASSSTQSTYDWDTILSAKVTPSELGKPGPAVELVQGEDFGDAETDPMQFAVAIKRMGAKRHLKVKTSIVRAEGKPNKIYVQVADMTDVEAAEADASFESANERNKQRVLKKRAEKKAGTNGQITETPATTPA